MASQYPPKKGAAYDLDVTLYTTAGAVAATLGTVVKYVSKDHGALAAAANSLTSVNATYGCRYLTLTATEMNADNVWVYVTGTVTGLVPYTASIKTGARTLDEGVDLYSVSGSTVTGVSSLYTPLTAITGSLTTVRSDIASVPSNVWLNATRGLTDKANFTLNASYDPAKTAAQASTLGAIGTNVSAILTDTGTTGVVVAGGSKSGYSLISAYDPAKTASTQTSVNNIAASITTVAASLSELTADVAAMDTSVLTKWVLNRLVPTDNGTTITWVLYDDDGTTPLKTWVYTKASGARAAAT